MRDVRLLGTALVALFGSSLAGAQGPRIAAPRRMIAGPTRTLYDPGALVFPGNDVPCASEGCRLVAMTVGDGRTFRVAVARVGADRRYVPAFVDSGGLGSEFDPVLQRLDASSVLLAYHADRALRFLRSTNDGDAWSELSHLQPPDGVAYSEAFLRRLDRGALAVVYARWDAASARTTIEMRTSADSGRDWSEPLEVGSSGAISDATRSAMGPVDDRGRAWIAYAARATVGDTVTVYVQRVEASTRNLLGTPRIVARVDAHPSNVGVAPVVLDCPRGPEVLFTAVGSDGRGRMYLARPESPDQPRVLLVRDRSANGFGRVWLSTTARSDTLQALVARSPDRSRSSIETAVVVPSIGCRP